MQSSSGNETISIFHPDVNDRAMRHHLCTQTTSAYVGQTARMYCCLARLDRNLSVSNGGAPFFKHLNCSSTKCKRFACSEKKETSSKSGTALHSCKWAMMHICLAHFAKIYGLSNSKSSWLAFFKRTFLRPPPPCQLTYAYATKLWPVLL